MTIEHIEECAAFQTLSANEKTLGGARLDWLAHCLEIVTQSFEIGGL